MKKLVIINMVKAALIFGCTVTVLNAAEEKTKYSLLSRIGLLAPEAEIIFVSDRDTQSRRKEIYAMDADGRNVTRLTFTDKHHFILGIDYSRRYLVVSRAEKDTDPPLGLGDEDKRSLWLLDLETKKEVRLTRSQHQAEGDSFSPDGEWIVFHMRLAGQEQSDIYKIRRNGRKLRRLTRTLNVIESDPAWSNDGKEIAFVSLDMQTKRFILKKMDVNGKNIQTIYDGAEGPSTPAFPPGNYDPSWSPDDQWIVFERAVKTSGENWGSGIWHIFKVKRDGSEVVDLSASGGHIDRAEYLPSFSSDGQFIVFGSMYQARSSQESHNDIFIMDVAGKSLRRLTDHPASDMFPVWIP